VLLAGEAGPEALVPLHRSPGNGPLPASFSSGLGSSAPLFTIETAYFNDRAQVDAVAALMLAKLRVV
jgi:hypothetical protein